MSLSISQVNTVPEGDGIEVKRLFPLHQRMNFDPFVLWDHFDIGPGHGFPEHPHRGFEAITYMFGGGMNHKDNLGNESFVSTGGAQRFTAGSGLIHSELPADKGQSNGIQLWINLPKRLKKIDPEYQQVNADDFPVHKITGGKIKTIVGEGSPLKLKTDVVYQHVTLDKQASYDLAIASKMRGIVYVIEGAINLNQQTVTADQAAFIEDINKLEFIAEENSQFMISLGMPHGEPIYQHGPYVD